MYEPNSCAPPVNVDEIRSFETYLAACDQGQIVFPDSYVEHLTTYHGGKPTKRYFRTTKGTRHVVTRFLNFADKSGPLADYNVKVVWSRVDDRLGVNLMPFADLFGGDLLCFDFSEGVASVVVWFHEESHSDSPPYVEAVADSFDAFLELLTEEVPK